MIFHKSKGFFSTPHIPLKYIRLKAWKRGLSQNYGRSRRFGTVPACFFVDFWLMSDIICISLSEGR